MTSATSAPDRTSRRILSIDGGGIKGTMPASFLASLEEDLERPIGEYFDLIAGTSTGGILAIGLSMGIPARQLLDLYVDRGPAIFGQSGGPWANRLSRRWRSAKHLFTAKHDAADLRTELEQVLGRRRIGDARTRLLVPSWDPDHRGVYIFKTAHHHRLKTDYKRPAIDAAMATAAAPTYFRRHRTTDEVGLTDGGTWSNNPIALAVVEAITLLGWSRSDLHVLSLGCGEEVYLIGEAPGWGSLATDLSRLFMGRTVPWRHGHRQTADRASARTRSDFPVLPLRPEGLFPTGRYQQGHPAKGHGCGCGAQGAVAARAGLLH